MTTNQKLSTTVTKTLDQIQQSLQQESPLAYQDLDHTVRELEDMAREAYQNKLKGAYRPLVKKLESGQSLTADERKLLELFIVGEAKYYLKHENDFENWQRELQRLSAEMAALQANGLQHVDDVMHLHALCRDAKRLVPDIAFYLREKERIERFKASTSGEITAEAGQLLAEMIKAMMTSDEM